VHVPQRVVAAARARGWRSGRVQADDEAWLFYASDGSLVCRLPRLGREADCDPADLPAEVLAAALARGWRDGPVAATDSGWLFEREDGPPIVIAISLGSGSADFDVLVEAAWDQGFRVEETDRGWYFYAPGAATACCGISRSRQDDPRALLNLLAALRRAGLGVPSPQTVSTELDTDQDPTGMTELPEANSGSR
jgi:hypothetical protein